MLRMLILNDGLINRVPHRNATRNSLGPSLGWKTPSYTEAKMVSRDPHHDPDPKKTMKAPSRQSLISRSNRRIVLVSAPGLESGTL